MAANKRPSGLETTRASAPGKRPQAHAGRIPASSLAAHDADLLAVARKIFCENGFERTTILAISREAHVSPKTIYSRYGGKEGIFGASIRVRADDTVEPLRAPITRKDDVYAALYEFAMRLLAVTSAREAVLIQRLVIAESQRFPEIGEKFLNAGPRNGVRMLSQYFGLAEAARYLTVPSPELAAEMFIGALLGIPARLALIPATAWYSPQERRKRAVAAVNLFLAAYSIATDA